MMAMSGAKAFNKMTDDPKLVEFIKQNPDTIVQNISVGFNAPQAPETTINFKARVGGPDYEKNLAKGKELK